MKWLTQKEVKAAAKKSKKAAIACSVLHWEQILTATKEELCDFYDNRSDDLVRSPYCALCCRFNDDAAECPKCPVPDKCKTGGSVWSAASYACTRLRYDNDFPLSTFRRKAQPMLGLLKSL